MSRRLEIEHIHDRGDGEVIEDSVRVNGQIVTGWRRWAALCVLWMIGEVFVPVAKWVWTKP